MDEEKPSAFADLLTGIAWLALSVAIMVGAWNMDRLERLAPTFHTAPGLVPGMLGIALTLMSVLLIVRAVRGGAFNEIAFPEIVLSDHWRLIFALVFGLFYAVFLIAHGLPFWIASAIYIAAMVFVFQYPERRDANQVVRGAAVAIVYGTAMSLGIHYLFQDLFLVRLP